MNHIKTTIEPEFIFDITHRCLVCNETANDASFQDEKAKKRNLELFIFHHEGCAEKFTPETDEKAEKLANLRAVMDLKQKDGVTVAFDDAIEGKRFYDVFSHVRGTEHHYPVCLTQKENSVEPRCPCIGFHRKGFCKHSNETLRRDAELFPVKAA